MNQLHCSPGCAGATKTAPRITQLQVWLPVNWPGLVWKVYFIMKRFSRETYWDHLLWIRRGGGWWWQHGAKVARSHLIFTPYKMGVTIFILKMRKFSVLVGQLSEQLWRPYLPLWCWHVTCNRCLKGHLERWTMLRDPEKLKSTQSGTEPVFELSWADAMLGCFRLFHTENFEIYHLIMHRVFILSELSWHFKWNILKIIRF